MPVASQSSASSKSTQAKGIRSKAVNRVSLEQTESFLKELPQKEKEYLSVSEAVAEMSETIRAVLARGYSYNEVAEMLSQQIGVSISPWSLRRYIPAYTQRRKRGRPATASVAGAPRRGRPPKNASAANTNGETASTSAPAQMLESFNPSSNPASEPTPVPASKSRPTNRQSRQQSTTAKEKSAINGASMLDSEPNAEAPAKKSGPRGQSTGAKSKTSIRGAKTSANNAASARGRQKTSLDHS